MKFVSSFDCKKCAHNNVCKYRSNSVLANLDTEIMQTLSENITITASCNNYLFIANVKNANTVKEHIGQDF